MYMTAAHWPVEFLEKTNEVTSPVIYIKPSSNMLLIFPAWMEHMVQENLKNDSRISLSFNTTLKPEKK